MARFLATIAILFLIFYGFRFLRLYVFPMLMRRWLQKFTNNQFNYTKHEQVKKEGEVSISKMDAKKAKRNDSDEGEYVDYEEIK